METINLPTIQQYEVAIKNSLSYKQIEILKTLFYSPNSSATAKELAEALYYKSYHGANRQIGDIGKKISENTNITPPLYDIGRGLQPAYFLLIGEYFKNRGWVMWDELKSALLNLNIVANDDENSIGRLPTEEQKFDEEKFFVEGKVMQTFVNRYERNQKARQECINHFGSKCFICNFNFGEKYGSVAEGFIHVHHKKSLAEINSEYIVNPIQDLIPVCANCHSVIHLRKPQLSVEEMKQLLKSNSLQT